jgi:hypothetical protein
VTAKTVSDEIRFRSRYKAECRQLLKNIEREVRQQKVSKRPGDFDF